MAEAVDYPRSLERGLIEVAIGRRRRAACWAYPRSLERGLIEGSGVERVGEHDGLSPFFGTGPH